METVEVWLNNEMNDKLFIYISDFQAGMISSQTTRYSNLARYWRKWWKMANLASRVDKDFTPIRNKDV